jgi:hypothetical protein
MMTHDLSLLNTVPEPTPIAIDNMKVVDQVSLEDTRSFEGYCYPCLLSLLQPAAPPPDTIRGSASAKSQPSVHIQNRSNQDSSYKSRSEKWNQRFRDLLKFRGKYGHCFVPLDWPQNPSLAHWIKHQRYQYKAKLEGKHSTLTEVRQETLEELGFVWDSHRATWQERFNEMVVYREIHGHSNVPSRDEENPKLSSWMKCQRRQYKLYTQGGKSHMTPERIAKLSSIGFVWFPRQHIFSI